jgi:hypothetical protein
MEKELKWDGEEKERGARWETEGAEHRGYPKN